MLVAIVVMFVHVYNLSLQYYLKYSGPWHWPRTAVNVFSKIARQMVVLLSTILTAEIYVVQLVWPMTASDSSKVSNPRILRHMQMIISR